MSSLVVTVTGSIPSKNDKFLIQIQVFWFQHHPETALSQYKSLWIWSVFPFGWDRKSTSPRPTKLLNLIHTFHSNMIFWIFQSSRISNWQTATSCLDKKNTWTHGDGSVPNLHIHLGGGSVASQLRVSRTRCLKQKNRRLLQAGPLPVINGG